MNTSRSIFVIIPGIIAVLAMIGCQACSKKSSTANVDTVDAMKQQQIRMAEARKYGASLLGKKTDITVSQDGTLLLCQRHDNESLDFLVINLDKEIVLEKRRIMGYVKWHTSHSLLVEELPGIIQDKTSDPQDYTRIIELNTSH